MTPMRPPLALIVGIGMLVVPLAGFLVLLLWQFPWVGLTVVWVFGASALIVYSTTRP